MSDVPVIDLSAIRDTDAAAIAALGSQVDAACRSIGFLIVQGHAVPPELIAAGPRVGVGGAGGTAEYPWRFWLEGDATVSTYRAAVVRRGSRPDAR